MESLELDYLGNDEDYQPEQEDQNIQYNQQQAAQDSTIEQHYIEEQEEILQGSQNDEEPINEGQQELLNDLHDVSKNVNDTWQERIMISPEEDQRLQLQFGKIRKEEMSHDLTMTGYQKVQLVMQEWAIFTQEDKLRLKLFLGQEQQALKRQLQEQQRDQEQYKPDKKRLKKQYRKDGKFQEFMQNAVENSFDHFDKDDILWEKDTETKINENNHYRTDVKQICEQIDQLKKDKKLRAAAYKKKTKKVSPYSVFTEQELPKLYKNNKSLDMIEAMKEISKKWAKLSENEQQAYDPDPPEPLIPGNKKKGQVEEKAKYYIKCDQNLTLTGFTYYAQKMRAKYQAGEFPEVKSDKKGRSKVNDPQPKHKRLKVAELMNLIQSTWDKLTEQERQEYEQKSEYVANQMKKRKYQNQDFNDKQYGQGYQKVYTPRAQPGWQKKKTLQAGYYYNRKV